MATEFQCVTIFSSMNPREGRLRLHDSITRELALRIIEAERRSQRLAFPNESELCAQLGVSRTVLRESMKVLVDKGLVEMRPRSGTRARPRAGWNLLDPDILAWQAELSPDVRLLRDICEVRLAIEPTGAGFAAVRARGEEKREIAAALQFREALAPDTAVQQVVERELNFQDTVIAASHNPLLVNLNAIIREPSRAMLEYTFRSPANVALALKAHRELMKALLAGDPVSASKAAEKAVGISMVAVEEMLRIEASITANAGGPVAVHS